MIASAFTLGEEMKSRVIRYILHPNLWEYAEGGAPHVLEQRATPGMESRFNYADDYFREIFERV